MEQFANGSRSQLTATINNSVTSLVVGYAGFFPSSGSFRVLIDSEIMIVTAVSGTTFTVTRAAEGTTAVSHDAGAMVNGVLTTGAIGQFRADTITTDVSASLPTVGTGGRIFLATDSEDLYYDDSSTWNLFGPRHKYTIPSSGSFTAYSAGGAATMTGTRDCITVDKAGTSNTASFWYLSPPSTPWTYTMNFSAAFHPRSSGSVMGGVMVACSGSTSSNVRMHGWLLIGTTTLVMCTTQFNCNFGTVAAPTWNGSPVLSNSIRFFPDHPIRWFRVNNNGTTVTYSFSVDGLNWIAQGTEPASNFTGGIDKVGFLIHLDSTYGKAAGMAIRSWLQT